MLGIKGKESVGDREEGENFCEFGRGEIDIRRFQKILQKDCTMEIMKM